MHYTWLWSLSARIWFVGTFSCLQEDYLLSVGCETHGKKPIAILGALRGKKQPAHHELTNAHPSVGRIQAQAVWHQYFLAV